MNEQTNHSKEAKIAELEARLTPLMIFEALRFGDKTPEGKRALDILNEIYRLAPERVPQQSGVIPKSLADWKV